MPPLSQDSARVAFSGRLLMLGFGIIGQGILPLIFRHIELPRDRISILAADAAGRELAEAEGLAFEQLALTPENCAGELAARLGPGDALLNLSVDVSSASLVEICNGLGALYVDTSNEPWLSEFVAEGATSSERSNYAFRARTLAIRERVPPGGPTAVLNHGANPGLVNHFVKQALLDIARDQGEVRAAPAERMGWARLARDLGVKAIHIAERDCQISEIPREPGVFANTWSIEGFISESLQPAELGWGTHEKTFPEDGGRHDFGSGCAIYLERPGALTLVRSWTPKEGPFHGFLITHDESISLAEYLTLEEGGEVVYRPTCHFAYHPADDAKLSIMESAGRNWATPDATRIMMDDIVDGMDELGVLLMGPRAGAYWYGSQLSIQEARRLAPHNNATSLQVAAGALGALVWAIENPDRGLVEPEELDHARVLEVAEPYLQPLIGVTTDWTPLQDRGQLFDEDTDEADPWQFKNIRVL